MRPGEPVQEDLCPGSGRGLDLIADLADLLFVRDPGRWSAGLARRAASIAMLLLILCGTRFASLREHARDIKNADHIRRLIRHIADPPARWASA
jgi:hypothetical protein